MQYLKVLTIPLFILFFNKVYSQQCNCNKYNYGTGYCDTTFLEDGGYLFYQYNCDSTWLTFINKGKELFVLYKTSSITMPSLYRLGYQLIKEDEKYLYFRYNCSNSATFGGCFKVRVCKKNGNQKKYRHKIFPDWY